MTGFGIDFGTTNSGAVELMPGGPLVFGDEDGAPLPSVVAIDKDTGHAIGGRQAWAQRYEREKDGRYHVIRSIKPYLGTDHQWPTNARTWTVEDVSAFVLRQLSDRARALGVADGIRAATFSVPVNTHANAKRVLKKAASQAGIEVRGFVSESTAAVFRYRRHLGHMRLVAVFDWGGGTLDVSVVGLRAGTVHELAVASTPIAGNAIDEEIARDLHRRIQTTRGTSLTFEQVSVHDRNTLILEAERVKVALSRAPEERVSTLYDGRLADLLVSRASLTAVVAPFVRQALELLDSTISRSGHSVDEIDQILMVGGTSQLWALRLALLEDQRFPTHYLADSPEWDVAHGAALLDAQPGSYEVGEDVALKLADGSLVPLLRSGDMVTHDKRALDLVLIEDAQEANVLIHRAVPGRPGHTITMTVPTLGFLEEELKLDYVVQPDLSVWVEGRGDRRGETRVTEIADLRFVYRLDV